MADEPTISALEAIHSTRAIRRFKPDPIPEDVLWAILDAAIRGPTGANRQNWGWVVVRDAEAKRQIAVWFKQEYDNTYGRVDESTLTDTGRIQSGTYNDQRGDRLRADRPELPGGEAPGAPICTRRR